MDVFINTSLSPKSTNILSFSVQLRFNLQLTWRRRVVSSDDIDYIVDYLLLLIVIINSNCDNKSCKY